MIHILVEIRTRRVSFSALFSSCAGEMAFISPRQQIYGLSRLINSLSPSCKILDRKAILQREGRNIPNWRERDEVELQNWNTPLVGLMIRWRDCGQVSSFPAAAVWLLSNMSLLKTQIATRQDMRLKCTTFRGLLLLNAKAGGINVGGTSKSNKTISSKARCPPTS